MSSKMITSVLSRTGIVFTLPQLEVMENGGGPGSTPGRSILLKGYVFYEE